LGVSLAGTRATLYGAQFVPNTVSETVCVVMTAVTIAANGGVKATSSSLSK
jgi:hypothetical protein